MGSEMCIRDRLYYYCTIAVGSATYDISVTNNAGRKLWILSRSSATNESNSDEAQKLLGFTASNGDDCCPQVL